MSLVELDGRQVTGGTLCLPRIGVWCADVAVDSDVSVSGSVVLKISDGALELRGTVVKSGPYAGAQYARIVGGKHGLALSARSRGYLRASVRNVLSDLMRASGESLSPMSESSVLSEQRQSWTVCGDHSCGVELARLLAASRSGPAWRIVADGTIWIGPETWSASPLRDYEVVLEQPELGSITIACDAPTLLPGATLGGRKVDYVEHELGGAAGIRSRVWLAE